MSADPVIQIVQIAEGDTIEFRGKRSFEKRKIKVNRVWQVLYNGEVIGAILYSLVTREQRTPGRMYVNSRWQSPAWQYVTGEKAKSVLSGYSVGFNRAPEQPSKKAAVDNIVWRHEQKLREEKTNG